MQASRWTMRLGWPLALVLGLAPSARAQVEEPRPYFYLWAAPSGGYGSALTDFASQIVRVKVDLYSTPGACATAVAFGARYNP